MIQGVIWIINNVFLLERIIFRRHVTLAVMYIPLPRIFIPKQSKRRSMGLPGHLRCETSISATEAPVSKGLSF